MATSIIMPRQGQSVESCVLVEWRVSPGDTVKVGTPLAAIETDKAVFEVESTADGTVLALFAKPGDDVPVLAPIAAVGEPGEDVSALRPANTGASAAAPASTAAPASPLPAAPAAPSSAAASTAAGVSPRARGRAKSAGIDPATLPGSGPNGRVIERDVRAAEATAPRLSPAARDAVAAGHGVAPAQGSGPGGMALAADIGRPSTSAPVATPAADTVQDIPLTGIRKIIADRMRQSLAGTAQLTLTRSFDATAILDYRRQIKSEGQTFGLPNITLNDMIAFATARTLRRHPALNAHVADGRISRHSAVHLGVATDTPRGLMVPVLRHADALPLPELSRQLKPLLEAAQSGTINPDLLRGGTFTITNMGMLGVETFTPILNAPEVAILGIGGLVWKPVEQDGAIRHVQSITLSLTIDHQAVDGAPGARFLQDLAAALQNFALTVTASA